MTILIAALALLAAPQAARPVPATEAQDAACLAIDLKTVMTTTAPLLNDRPRLATESKRCGAEMKATGTYMLEVGGALKSGG